MGSSLDREFCTKEHCGTANCPQHRTKEQQEEEKAATLARLKKYTGQERGEDWG